mmetsp:Transcript_58564/g.186703  ORF Transcript_58564/g.186703 Transcript_58564/m.186703 type:complete len:192 (-) Transcript_58564:10-585(-)
MALFGAVFVGHSFPITSEHFTRTSEISWVIDVSASVTTNYQELKEVCLFLTMPNALPPGAALSLFVSVGGGVFDYRGSVSNTRPSETIQCSWPEPAGLVQQGEPIHAQIGIRVESEAEAAEKIGQRVGAKEDFAKRVAMDLFRFMESFQGSVPQLPNMLVVPTNVLDRWFTKFQDKFRRDPDFLTRAAEKD